MKPLRLRFDVAAFLVLAAVAGGCAGDMASATSPPAPKSANAEAGGISARPAIAEPKANVETGSTPPVAPAKTPARQTAKPEVAQATVPNSLKHDAYRYLGLGNPNAITMKITNPLTRTTTTSEQRTTLKQVGKGFAVYTSEMSEAGSAQVVIEYTVTKDGVYAREPAAGSKVKPQLQLPAIVTRGRTWTTTEKYAAKDLAATTVATNRIVGLCRVKTAKGEFPALLVEAKGTLKRLGTTSPIQTKMWLVKDIGPVRVEMTVRTPGSKKPVNIVSEIQ